MVRFINGFKKYKEHGEDVLVDGRGKGKPQTMMSSEELKEAEIKTLKERNKLLENKNG
ncbi:hypothetical protein LZT99_05355 [Staphylococcus epidermidis]|nr:hypothetical protein [Staphylococcus epidermidis]MCO6290563.1 hypothetical protein [Staphylococcus epidermidis]